METQYTKQIPSSLNDSCISFTWTGMQNGDTGQPVELANHADRSIQVFGVFGAGGLLKFEGSNDGVNYAPLSDMTGNPLQFTAAKLRSIMELARFVRPVIVSGDANTALDAVLFIKGC